MSVDPYQTPEARVADPPDEYLEATWARAAKVWWSFMWRTVIFAALAGGLLGFDAGAMLARPAHRTRPSRVPSRGWAC